MIALAAFAPALMATVRVAAGESPPEEVAAIVVFILSVSVTSMMAVFLWSTPALSSELEGRSWVYLAMRPHGPLAVLLGKYLVAVSWTLPIGLCSAILSVLILGSPNTIRLIWVESALVCLSCIAYSALFLLIGVVVPKRAMVAGVAYALLVEFALAFIPAAVNVLTVQYRLRCLLVRWMEFDVRMADQNPVFTAYFGEEGWLWHLAMLLALALGFLIAAGLLLKYREFTSASETET
jgi:ABC-type transport system involved in multi-copper enzyme maturation permease subunit